MRSRFLPVVLLALLGACQQDPDVISSTPSEITLKTHGDMATAEARARAYCGRKRLAILNWTTGPEPTATFRCT
jgi:hypothetical protein